MGAAETYTIRVQIRDQARLRSGENHSISWSNGRRTPDPRGLALRSGSSDWSDGHPPSGGCCATSLEITWDAGQRVATLNREHDHQLAVDGLGGITFIPNVFSWPHLRVYCDSPWMPRLVYPIASVRRPEAPPPPEQLVERLRSLGAATRLQLLRLTAQQPRATQELAALVSLSKAAVSRTLQILAASGLRLRHVGRPPRSVYLPGARIQVIGIAARPPRH